MDAIHSERGRSNFDTIMEACSENLKHFEELSIVFSTRYANNITHVLAQAARSMSGPIEWFDIAPRFILIYGSTFISKKKERKIIF